MSENPTGPASDPTPTTSARSQGRRRVIWALIALLGLGAALLTTGWLLLERAVRNTTAADLLLTPTPGKHPAIATSPVVLDRHDRLLRAFAVADGRWRLPVRLADVDPLLVDLLLAFEDRRFYRHAGVDGRALLRAATQALRQRRIVSGASTLTMQVVRLRTGAPTRSLAGKWRQLVGALALERVADKDAILTAYLHLAPYGGNLEGIRAASLAWLGKEPKRLSTAEAALLVALPQAPTARRPDLDPAAARRGRDRVLARALALGIIDADTAAAARAEPVPTRRRAFPLLAAHSAERVVRAVPGRPIPGQSVHRLTLDADLQAQLEPLVAEYARRIGERVSGALLVADHQAGEVLAAVGSAGALDTARGGFIDMTRALRSPGSTLKPLIYGLAFEQGLAHPESLIEDRPSGYGGYAPENFDRGWQGTVTVRQALQWSLNIPAVTLLEAVGPVRLLARLRRAGATPALPASAPPGLAIGLGGVGVTLRDLTAVYAAIARGGQAVALTELRPASDGEPAAALAGQAKPAATAGPSDPIGASRQPVLDRRAAWQVAAVLSLADHRGEGGEPIAIKTGTSYGYRDAWAIGFDGRHVVGVWLGRPDAGAVPGLTGGDHAVPLLRDTFARLGPPTPLPAPPPHVLLASTGQLPPTLTRVHQHQPASGAADAVEIAYPPTGARIDLGLAGAAASDHAIGPQQPLALKVRNGQPPFIWFADGQPIAHEPFARQTRWQPPGPGYTTIAVIDGRGSASRVTVRLD